MNRSTVLLLILLLVLGGIVFLVLPSDEERMTSYTRTPVSFNVDSAAIVRLDIDRAGKRLTIEKIGGVWTITSNGNLRADPAAVNQVVGGLSRFQTGSLISDNPSKQGLFQVDSSGSEVSLTDRGGNKQTIIIGKMGPSFSEVYFRMPGSPEVYLGSGITTWSLNKEIRDWRDKTVFASPAENMTAVKIASGGKSREYTRDSTGWKSNGENVPTETINPILTTLAGIRAEDFLDSTVDFGGAPATVEISGPTPATLNFYRLKTDTNRYAVVSSESPQKYLVGKYVATQLFRNVGEPKPIPAAVTGRTSVPPAAPDNGARSVPARSTPPATSPATNRAVPPPVTTEKGADAATGTKAGASTEPAVINPFKQKTPAERQSGTGGAATPPVKTPVVTPPPARQAPVETGRQAPAQTPQKTNTKSVDDDGELTVHVVAKGETMTTIAKDYGVTVEQILKWNLLKSISVRPGQELYIFVRK